MSWAVWSDIYIPAAGVEKVQRKSDMAGLDRHHWFIQSYQQSELYWGQQISLSAITLATFSWSGEKGRVSGGSHRVQLAEQGSVPVPCAPPHPGLGDQGQGDAPGRRGEVQGGQHVRLRHRLLRHHLEALRQQPGVRLRPGVTSSNKICEINKQIITMCFKSPQKQRHRYVLCIAV